MQETIRVRFRWSEDEFVLAYRLWLRSSPMRFLAWFAWVFFAACMYMAYQSWHPGAGWLGVGYSVFFVAAGTFVLIVRGPGQYWLIRRRFRQRPDRERDIHYEFDEKGYTSRTEGLASAEATWGLVQRAILAPEGVLLFQTPRQYMYVSGSGFADVAERERFDALVRETIPVVTSVD